jgi:vacuolar-type H+-ATPase subunit F/Vma7
MGVVVVLGESVRVQGYALAGATTIVAETSDEVFHAWDDLESSVTLVVLTSFAAETLGGAILTRTREPLAVAMTS